MDLHVTIPTAHGGLTLKNPIMPAASTFGNIIEYAKVFDLNKLGALMGNSMYLTDGTPTGNQKFHRAEDGFMSAFGRNAISIRRFVEEILPELPWETTPVILDLKEAGMEQMEEMVAYVADTGKVAGVEINLNCPYAPGVPKYWQDPEQLTEFIHRVRKAAGTMMVGAKAPTGNYNVAQVTKTLHQAGADSFTCYNGQMGCAVDIYTRKFCFGGVRHHGLWLSGLRPLPDPGSYRGRPHSHHWFRRHYQRPHGHRADYGGGLCCTGGFCQLHASGLYAPAGGRAGGADGGAWRTFTG